MARLYERYLKVLQNWPRNPEYPVPLRSLPEYVRTQGKVAFSARGDFKGDVQQCERRLASLERLSRDHWLHAYPRAVNAGALGVTAEACRFALSEDYQKALETSRLVVLFNKIFYFKKGNGKAES